MSMEIRQHLKLSQQLVMTPQLQQAIKLLQLSRVELVDMVRDELLENPVLEDSVDVSLEQAKPGTDGQGTEAAREEETLRIGETETPVTQVPAERAENTAEVKPDTRPGEAVAEFD
jgi:RNA polymerase sigma-54 factor